MNEEDGYGSQTCIITQGSVVKQHVAQELQKKWYAEDAELQHSVRDRPPVLSCGSLQEAQGTARLAVEVGEGSSRQRWLCCRQQGRCLRSSAARCAEGLPWPQIVPGVSCRCGHLQAPEGACFALVTCDTCDPAP